MNRLIIISTNSLSCRLFYCANYQIQLSGFQLRICEPAYGTAVYKNGSFPQYAFKPFSRYSWNHLRGLTVSIWYGLL
jgi:hypothetical protein